MKGGRGVSIKRQGVHERFRERPGSCCAPYGPHAAEDREPTSHTPHFVLRFTGTHLERETSHKKGHVSGMECHFSNSIDLIRFRSIIFNVF